MNFGDVNVRYAWPAIAKANNFRSIGNFMSDFMSRDTENTVRKPRLTRFQNVDHTYSVFMDDQKVYLK